MYLWYVVLALLHLWYVVFALLCTSDLLPQSNFSTQQSPLGRPKPGRRCSACCAVLLCANRMQPMHSMQKRIAAVQQAWPASLLARTQLPACFTCQILCRDCLLTEALCPHQRAATPFLSSCDGQRSPHSPSPRPNSVMCCTCRASEACA